MADNTIDTLQIEIQSSAKSASKGIESLISGLSRLNDVLSKNLSFDKGSNGLNNLESGINKFNKALSGLDTSKLDKANKGLRSLDASAKDLNGSLDRISGNAFLNSGNKLKNSLSGVGKGIESSGKSADKAKSGLGGLAFSLGSLYLKFKMVKGALSGLSGAIETASQLTEVQNVVDTTFGNMSGKLDEFSKNAIKDFGMSELSAKQFASQFQAMGTAMGITGQQVKKATDFINTKKTADGAIAGYNQASNSMADMSINLTKLSADMASFYDVEQSTVAKALQSGILANQSRPLRQFGLDLTEATLKSWALSQGLNADIKSMTQAEKAMLRYQYIMANTAASQNDFKRTGDGWHNTLVMLKQQLQQLATIIGSVLIQVIKPVVQKINAALASIIQWVQKAYNALGKFFGWKMEINTKGLALDDDMLDMDTSGIDGIADSADTATKATKKLKNQLQGFDKLNVLTSNKDTSAKSTKAATPAVTPSSDGISMVNTPVDTSDIDKADSSFQRLIKRAKELGGLFKQGFEIGFGNSNEKIESIRKNLQSIADKAKEIWDDPKVVTARDNFMNSLAFNAGKVAGSMASIGLTAANNLTGGFSGYLEKSAPYIKDRISSMFNVGAEISNQAGDFAVAVADIFDVFNSPEAMSVTSSIIGIFADGFLGATDLAGKFGRDIFTLVTQPVIDNTEKIKTAIQNTIDPISITLETLHNSVKDTFNKIHSMYDKHIKPLFDSLTTGVSEIVGTILDGYNTYIAPVLKKLSKQFKETWEQHVQPCIDEGINLVGKIADTVKTFWETILQPFINWMVKNIWPVLGPVLDVLGSTAIKELGHIADSIKEVFKVMEDVLDFVCDVFEGDWDSAWKDIKKTFKDTWDAVSTIARKPLNALISMAESVANSFIYAWNSIKRAINSLSISIPDWVPDYGGQTIGFNLRMTPTISLERFEKGGFPGKFSLFMAGEYGIPEIIGTVGGKSAVAGGQEITGIRDEIYSTGNRQIAILQAQLDAQKQVISILLSGQVGRSDANLFDTVRNKASEYTMRTGRGAFEF